MQSEIVIEVTQLPCYNQRIQVTAISSVFRCFSATFWCESSTKVLKFLFVMTYLLHKLRIVSLFVIMKGFIQYLGFIEITFTRSEAYCQVTLLVQLSYDCQIAILSCYIQLFLQSSFFLRLELLSRQFTSFQISIVSFVSRYHLVSFIMIVLFCQICIFMSYLRGRNLNYRFSVRTYLYGYIHLCYYYIYQRLTGFRNFVSQYLF